MATDLKIYGPFEVPCAKNGATKFIDRPHKRLFLEKIATENLSKKQGCYIFALRAGRGFCPWYVGKATKTMHQECLGTYQMHQYNAVIAKSHKGSPVMFFVSPEGTKKKVPRAICAEMEAALIQAALSENPHLRNVQKAKVPAWGIDGVLRGRHGKPTKRESAFRKMMGF